MIMTTGRRSINRLKTNTKIIMVNTIIIKAIIHPLIPAATNIT